ncbi:amidase domain protein [Metarhizium robertsii]|uniref:Amidase domain protein n=1 Tax=Metarhizium robertsii TaxID=568076 RepID=A0A0A1URU1_9HYPO|nr:amidase domain protein [Metarhizium robertsii]
MTAPIDGLPLDWQAGHRRTEQEYISLNYYERSTEPEMGMINTGGKLALVDSCATENAPIVNRVCNGEPAYDIAVAAGFAPVATGTETEGSVVSPATRQSLWTIKPALGTIPNQGIIPVSGDFDIAGPVCKTVQDTAVVLAALGQRCDKGLTKGLGAKGLNSILISKGL